jgi:hypothetical protein
MISRRQWFRGLGLMEPPLPRAQPHSLAPRKKPIRNRVRPASIWPWSYGQRHARVHETRVPRAGLPWTFTPHLGFREVGGIELAAAHLPRQTRFFP